MKRAHLLSVTLLSALSLAISGCSGSVDKGQPKDSAKPQDSVKPQASGTAANGMKDGKYDPPITLTTVRAQQTTVKFAQGDSIENNVWTRAYEKEYGIKLKTLWAVDPNQLEQKMNLTIASGDIPDFFQVNATQFKQLAEAGLIADMTEAYNKHASEGVKKLMTEGGEKVLQSATIGGKLMAIPFTSPTQEGSQMVYVRTDWLQKLNLPEPKTMDDLLKISEAFTTKDPDGNGKNDTYGLAVDKDFSILLGFFNSFHAYYGINIKDANGNLAYSTIQPEMKTALKKLQEMFKAGQIDPEFGAKNATKTYEMIANGKIGMFYNGPYAGLYPLQAAKDKDPSMEWKAFPLASVDGKPAKSQVELGVAGYWVVKKGVKNPEAVLKMLDFWLKTFYENKSDDIYKEFNTSPTDNNQVWLLNAVSAYKSFKNVDESLRIIEALDTKDMSKLTPEDKGVYEKIQKFQAGDRSNWGWNLIFNKGGSMSVADQYRKNNLYLSNEFITTPLTSMIEKGTALTKLESEALTKIILGQSSIDEFDKYVEQWKKQGGDEIVKEINEWYKTTK
ncbi:extracellular solute-binding protein [Paenibacillus sp. MBLB4367]|uniref:extracellular solute-binding protein n=1 Tax=Paenibacillus sp. MBLB4367 TaxID=3384767 RepID=UPI003907FD56